MSVVQKSETGLKTHTYEKIGHMYLDFLCEQDNFVEAAKRCTSILAHNQESWEHYFYKFRDSGKIQVRKTIYYLFIASFSHASFIQFSQYLHDKM